MRPLTRRPPSADAVRQATAPGRSLYKSPRWVEARKLWLAKHPACVVCGRRAKHVDHVVPHRGDVQVFFDARNWQSLCHSCHSAKTARADGGFGNPAGPAIVGCDADGLPLDPAHPWRQGR